VSIFFAGRKRKSYSFPLNRSRPALLKVSQMSIRYFAMLKTETPSLAAKIPYAIYDSVLHWNHPPCCIIIRRDINNPPAPFKYSEKSRLIRLNRATRGDLRDVVDLTEKAKVEL
jgi:hypothetical protein